MHTRFLKFVSLIFLVIAAGLGAPAAQQQRLPANELVRRVVENELKHTEDHSHYMYKDWRQTPALTTTKEMIETNDGTIARLIAVNDGPVPPEQRAEDDAKLDNLVKDPEAMRKKHKAQDSDAERVERMFREIPKAFLFEYEGTERAANGDEVVRLSCKPNPDYKPPSREMSVYAAMQGHMWVDTVQNRLVRIDASLFRDVNFGWGILGHLDKGGHFMIEQTEVGPGRWEATTMNIQFTGKMLLFKTINLRQVEKLSDWRRVPDDLTVAQAVQMLRKNETSVAQNGGGH